MIWIWPSQNTLGMWTVLYWTRSSRTQFGVSINVCRLLGDTLNITCNFLYCNHHVHRDFLITLYITMNVSNICKYVNRPLSSFTQTRLKRHMSAYTVQSLATCAQTIETFVETQKSSLRQYSKKSALEEKRFLLGNNFNQIWWTIYSIRRDWHVC
jgi:hypothetical protein